MERLMEKVGETVFLGIMNGDHITILDVVESHNEMKITSPPGTRLPLLAGATGKVFLSQLEEKRTKEIIQKMGLVEYTSKTVVDPKKFLKEIKETKNRKYAMDDEEYLLGVRAIAAPIETTSLPPAAIWVVGFTSSLNDQKKEKVITEIKKTTHEISQLLKNHTG
jgi:DNA-binding IclR family transcriptional regulator